MSSVYLGIKNEIQKIFDYKKNNKKIDELIMLQSPVKSIKNGLTPVQVITQ